MILFTKLILAHLLGEFLMQPSRWVRHKEANKMASGFLYLHVILHFGLLMLLVWDAEFLSTALFIAGTHFAIDLGRVYARPFFRNKNYPFFIDQLLHLGVLYGAAFYGSEPAHSLGLINAIDWALVTAVVFVTLPSAVIMGKLLQPMSEQIAFDHKSLPNAGKYIGMIERLFVLAFIIMGRWEGIGLLITAKSVFRFNDLKESNSRKLTEYILIGTLLSFGIAMLTGLCYMYAGK